MADYYTHYSFIVPCDDPIEVSKRYDALHEEWETACVAAQANLEDDPPHPIFDSAEYEMCYPPALHPDAADTPPHCWINGDVDGDVDMAAMAVQWILRNAAGAPDELFFEWSADCSKPRLDAFGGGAILITRDGMASLCTGDLTELLRLKLTNERTSQ